MRDRDAPLTAAELDSLAWAKMDGLLPAAVQDAATSQLLMLGYMNRDALAATLESGFVTFYSRSKDRLWQKGETSGNRLKLVAVRPDCDADALLVLTSPEGPTCHLGTSSCFGSAEAAGPAWLGKMETILRARAAAPPEESYTARLLAAGLPRIAQKVGEEGVETALAAVTRDEAGLAEEAADLLYHLTVLLHARGLELGDVARVLQQRHLTP
jgi:phosphoribosyl-AMP cyclohydrolase / phosphoribosyl-ATP pyrophosphohydrolase